MTRPIVVLSLEPWDDVWRRNQYLIDGLLRLDPALRVLFVEPAADPVYAALSRRLPRPGAGRRVPPGGDGRLILFQPTKWLPRVAGSTADRLLRRQVTRAVRRLGWERPALWVNDPRWAQIVVETGWPSLYDMTDDWVEATRSGRESRRLRETDALLLRVADAVVVCSRGLETSRGRVRPVHLVPNAVDVDRYRTPVARPGDLSAGEVALYAGTLHEDRLDVDLVVGTARALRDRGASVVLVGPNALTAENTAILEAQPNVHVLGARPWHAVPAYLQHADVLIVPHVVDGFTESLDPIKLYEYLAVGRPIASTPVAGFRERDGRGVAVARAEDFPEKVAGLIAEQPRTLPAEDVPTWDERVAAMLGILRELPA